MNSNCVKQINKTVTKNKEGKNKRKKKRKGGTNRQNVYSVLIKESRK